MGEEAGIRGMPILVMKAEGAGTIASHVVPENRGKLVCDQDTECGNQATGVHKDSIQVGSGKPDSGTEGRGMEGTRE